jgi:hypothetical protein
MYKLSKPVDGFESGEQLTVTAEYGGWHPYDYKLEPVTESATGSVELTYDKLVFVT